MTQDLSIPAGPALREGDWLRLPQESYSHRWETWASRVRPSLRGEGYHLYGLVCAVVVRVGAKEIWLVTEGGSAQRVVHRTCLVRPGWWCRWSLRERFRQAERAAKGLSGVPAPVPTVTRRLSACVSES